MKVSSKEQSSIHSFKNQVKDLLTRIKVSYFSKEYKQKESKRLTDLLFSYESFKNNATCITHEEDVYWEELKEVKSEFQIKIDKYYETE